MRKLLLLRPEPGLSASAERARAMGLEVVTCPLFRIEAMPWEAPAPSDFDALLVTSANAIRNGGPQLKLLKSLPVHAVGEASAKAAREAGFRVDTVGQGNGLDLLAMLPASSRLLHLAGEDHRDVRDDRINRVIVYRSAPVGELHLPPIDGLVAAIHSARAGARFNELADRRAATTIAAISNAAREACGPGWERVEVAEHPDDNSLLALAARLCHTSPQQ